jgi:hypothetical protein
VYNGLSGCEGYFEHEDCPISFVARGV